MSYRVLVIDDAGFVREIVRAALADSEFQVVGEAVDGVEGVKAAEALKPDIVLMDLVMPNKNGIEATKEILQSQPKCRVIACSTVDQQSVVLSAIEAGCCSYLNKPFRAEELIAVLKKSIKG